MSEEFTDPRDAGGDIAGPGGPHDEGQVVFDTRRAVLLEHTTVAQMDNPSDGRTFWGMTLEGRINQAEEGSRVLYLFDLDGAAAIIAALHGLAERAGVQRELHQLLEERWKERP